MRYDVAAKPARYDVARWLALETLRLSSNMNLGVGTVVVRDIYAEIARESSGEGVSFGLDAPLFLGQHDYPQAELRDYIMAALLRTFNPHAVGM